MSNNHIPMGLRHGAVVGVLLLAGCLVKDPYYCGDGHCELEGFPFCDVDGSLSGLDGPRCIAVECEPLQFKACRVGSSGDEALVCNTTGDNYDIAHCEFGCNAETGGCNACKPGSSECEARIIPRYVPNVCELAAPARELNVTESTTLTPIPDNCNGGFIEQVDGSCICVMHYSSVNVAANKTLKVTGIEGGQACALALVADHALIIEGTLDISADKGISGPGGDSLSPPLGPTVQSSGHGGAGFKTAGAPGGNEFGDGAAGNGGTPMMDPALLTNLIGGNRMVTTDPVTSNGGGGGAITLVSCRGIVSVIGTIDAGGGGGQGRSSGSAPGGGSGGYIVIQGMDVSITGQIYANGGGGGSGVFLFSVGKDGEDGSRSDVVGAPGGAGTTDTGAGGTGGCRMSSPRPGEKAPLDGMFPGGGGGGSVGFLQTYTPAEIEPTLTPVVASPELQPNRTIEVRLPPQ